MAIRCKKGENGLAPHHPTILFKGGSIKRHKNKNHQEREQKGIEKGGDGWTSQRVIRTESTGKLAVCMREIRHENVSVEVYRRNEGPTTKWGGGTLKRKNGTKNL